MALSYDALSFCSGILDIAQQGSHDLLMLVLNNINLYDFDINQSDEDGNTLLHIVAKQGASEILQKLLNLGANPNALNKRKETPLFQACQSKKLDTVRILVHSKVKLDMRDVNGNTALTRGIEHNQEEIAKYLMKRGANANTTNILNENLLHTSVKSTIHNIIPLLRHKGPDINQLSVLNETPLLLAVTKNHYHVAKYLISAGANVSTVDTKGRGIVHLAVRNLNQRIVELLIDSGVDLNSKDSEGCTPLHYCVDVNSIELASILLLKGARVDEADADGYTPLHLASSRPECFDVLKLLVQHGADRNVKTAQGDLAIDLATLVENHKGLLVLCAKAKTRVDINTRPASVDIRDKRQSKMFSDLKKNRKSCI